MRQQRSASAMLGFVAMYVIIGVLASVRVTEAQQHRVLAVHAARREAPGPIEADRVLQRVLGEQFPKSLDYYAEYIDVARFPSLEYRVALKDFLARKYDNQRFDLVIASTDTAAAFVRDFAAELFPRTPVVMSVGRTMKRWPGSTSIVSALDLSRTFALVSALQPDVRRVFIISGASEFDKFYENLIRQQLRPFEQRFAFTYLSGLPIEGLVERVRSLPADSIAYPLTITQDGDGQRFQPLDSFDRIVAASNRPVYAWSSLVMDRGVVGGNVVSSELIARHVAAVAARVLRGEDPDRIGSVAIDPVVSEVDWRQLRRWGIDPGRVPAGTVVRFREPGLWDRYRAYVLGIGALLLLETALIAGLLLQRSRRRRVEAALRRSHEENRDLAGRLIAAQEAERTRIARDLHDDVSQQLAGLAITLSGLKRKVSRSSPEPEVENTLTALQERTSALAENIRSLSHDLHPGVLQHAGLAAALQAHCSEFERHHQNLLVTFSAGDNLDTLDPAVALCLYRVTQEALSNTARHAHARAVQVRVARTASGTELSVIDDGIGFDPTQRRISSLGLRSIDERVRLTKGRFVVQSQLGHGTKLLVEIPTAGSIPDLVRHA